MSLFPAYSDQTIETNNKEQAKNDASWLENSSFKVDVNLLNEISTVESEDSIEKKVHGEVGCEEKIGVGCEEKIGKSSKKKSRKRKKQSREDVLENLVVLDDLSERDFWVDTKRTKEFSAVTTIARPAVSKYHVKYHLSSKMWKHRKHKIKRYFSGKVKVNDNDKSDTEERPVLTKENIDRAKFQERDENFTGFQQEADLSKRTEFYNCSLAEKPNDITMWLDYVHFQDTVYKFEKTYRKGSIAKGLRVLAERKMLILDKALSHNPNCEALLRERLNIAVSVYPSDELQLQLKDLVEKEQGNIILWQGYIEATQCSMSHCNSPAVLKLYTKCLSTLHKLRRNSAMEKILLEESILRMLYQCGLFLKQAGLFEQFWTLLRMYLELNLAPNDKTKFNINSRFDEQQLVELEDIVFKSQLPLHELWLRTEKLRESCHWVPYLGDDECEDPQRIVFTEDVAELIHPITMPDNIFKLTALIITLLKIPLLPCRHSTMQKLGLDYVPWSLDSIESLLPVFLPPFPIDISSKLLSDNRLAVGPQYLKALPGQDEYLDFILMILWHCIECLKGNDKQAVTIWWFRFQRLLIALDKCGRYKMSQYFKKKIKSNVKNLLKQEQHRNNQIFYCEYALIEFEFGNQESTVDIILKAMSINKVIKMSGFSWGEAHATQCYLYRNLVETSLKLSDSDENKLKVINYLINLALEKDQNSFTQLNEVLLKEVELKFKSSTLQLLQNNFDKLPPVKHFLPNFPTEWIICHGWFIYLTKGPIECGVLIEDCLTGIDDKNKEPLWQKEVLFEFYVGVLFRHCTSNPGCGLYKVFNDVLYQAIENYPNNLFFLSVLAKGQNMVRSMGLQWWKVKSLLLKTNRAFPILFTILIANNQLIEIQESLRDTITGSIYEVNTNHKNRMLSLFRQITKPDMCTRRCGLVWRLYLQFVHSYLDSQLCRNVYYSAVEECPWLKALYIDAAIYIPAELTQIQDLIIEKQLRLHVTPEELDILRS